MICDRPVRCTLGGSPCLYVEAGEEVEMSVEGIARFVAEHAELPVGAASAYKESQVRVLLCMNE